MSIDRAKAALAVFESALDLSSAERKAWVHKECGEDSLLAAEVFSLLSVHAKAGDFMAGGPAATKIFTSQPPPPVIAIVDGQQLGDFVIEREIGAGGMGVVYRARQFSLNRYVALKVLPPHLRNSRSAQDRFQREVEAAARLTHPNIVAVYTTGADRDTSFYAMELIDGPTLSEVINALKIHPVSELISCIHQLEPGNRLDPSTLAQRGDITPLPSSIDVEPVDLALLGSPGEYFKSVARLVAQVADGLHYAHSMKVVHRDIKPSNLLLSLDREIHIGDFGLARIGQEPSLTRTGEVIGTPYYMAPEQIFPRMGEVDGRTDLYSLSATLYEMLCLRPPFCGERREQVIAQIAHEEPVPPREINPRVPRDLETICLKSLEKSPVRRYQNAEEMAADLRRFIDGSPIAARAMTPLAQGIRWLGRHRTWSAALLAICMLAIVASFFAYRSHVSETRWSDAQFAKLFEEAQMATFEGNVELAGELIDEAQGLGAPEPLVQLLRGQFWLQTGQYQDACDALEEAVQAMPDSLAAHALLANAYQSNEEHEKSAAITPLLSKLTPITLQDFLLLGQAQIQTDFEQGLETLDTAVQLNRTSVQARLTRGCALAERAEDKGDVEIAERALDDLRIAQEMLEPNYFLIGNTLEGCLTAATTNKLAGDHKKYQEHLKEAARLAEHLQKFDDHYQSHRWRGLYFEFIDDDEQALRAWQAMEEWQIAYLVLNLMRLERVDEALRVCERRIARYPYARSTQFFRSVLLTTKVDEAAEVVAAFAPSGGETLDPVNLHRFNYINQCLAGNLERARELSRKFDGTPQSRTLKDPWRPHLQAFTCGEIDDEEFLARSSDSRYALSQAYFFMGMTHLAEGKRDEARQYFRKTADMKIVGYLEDAMSRSFLVQLERHPRWPKWIPSN